MQGHYYKFVKSEFWRIELEIILWTFLDFMALCPILIIHHQNFKNEKKDKRNSTVNLSDDSEESDELVQEGTNDKDVFLV